jgi:hypothetical protein
MVMDKISAMVKISEEHKIHYSMQCLRGVWYLHQLPAIGNANCIMLGNDEQAADAAQFILDTLERAQAPR